MSGRTSRAKGSRWQRTCRQALKSLGLTVTARQAGESGDDLVLGAPFDWLSVECKDQSRDSLPSWVDQAVTQAGANRVGIVWHKRRGKPDPMDGFITMRARDFWERVA